MTVEHTIEEGDNVLIQQASIFCAMKENLMQFIPTEMPLDFEADTETAPKPPLMGPRQFRRENPTLNDRDLAYAYCEYLRRQPGIGDEMTKQKRR